MIPVLASMVALYIVHRTVEAMWNRERSHRDEFSFADGVALVALLGAIGGAAWIWGLSNQAEAEMQRAEQEYERLMQELR